MFGVLHEVNAEIGAIRSMSAHGDYDDLCQFLSCQDPKQVKRLFLVHGEYNVQQDFKQRLIRKGFGDVEIPEMHYEIGPWWGLLGWSVMGRALVGGRRNL